MIKVYTTIAKQRHNYSDERRRELLLAMVTDLAYIAQERNVQNWRMKVDNVTLSLACWFYMNGSPDLKTEDVFVQQFLRRGIQQEFITIDQVKEAKHDKGRQNQAEGN